MIDLLIQDIPYDLDKNFNDWQKILMLARQIQLAIGCLILLFIIISIIYKRLYVYNTTKLFMFFCICYFIGMAIVLAHIPSFMSNYLYYYDDLRQFDSVKDIIPVPKQHYILNVLNEMKDQNKMIFCALQAFINLYFYNLGYFFVVLISYNVFCVINQNHRNFMKNVFKMNKVRIALVFMLIIYIVPLILSLTHKDFSEYYSYSYGPTGFKIKYNTNNPDYYGSNGYVNASLFLFCGMCSNPQSIIFQIVVIANIYTVPLLLFFIHLLILLQNRKKTKTILTSQYLNSKQMFLIRSGKISFVVFIVQALNFGKSFIVLLPQIKQWYIFIIVLNFAFDFYPFVFLIFYLIYTKQKRGLLHGSSTILSQE